MEKKTESPFKRPRYGLYAVALGALPFLWALSSSSRSTPPTPYIEATLAHCRALNQTPGPPENFHSRKESDRFEKGTKPTLIKNGRIWTGGQNGTEVVHGDILLDNGLILEVGHIRKAELEAYGLDLQVVDADGAWVTPGIVDIHSHHGVGAMPKLNGALDYTSNKATIQPWLRSVDGLNTHDETYRLSVAGGVTTTLILPGSEDAIGGQAFPIKLRPTSERSTSAMLLEPPFTLNGTSHDHDHIRWRHMKQACGETPGNTFFGNSRLDTYWAFREAYNHASMLKKKQDEFCSSALSGTWNGADEFPEDLQWEALVDVVRGRVKVHIHCYESVDFDAMVRLTNEFKFSIAAFHHAHEAYLVPELIKKAYGTTPAFALFSTAARYKREAYRGSEFAPRILAENGFTVLIKSDHPLSNSRYLVTQAQQAHYYGFAANLALASVTSNAAEIMGTAHRIGYVKKGWDADLVIWDSHPLALGATPKQVFIDGIAQIVNPYVVAKAQESQSTPKVPNFDKEAAETIKYEGLPPLDITQSSDETVVFTNVKTVFLRADGAVMQTFQAENDEAGVVVAKKGKIVCLGTERECLTDVGSESQTIDLEGGSISPGLLAYGMPLGLQHINLEPSTTDGDVYDPLLEPVPQNSVIQAVDGLMFGTRDALLAYRAGVTSAVTAPSHKLFTSGLSTWFSTGAGHILESGAVLQDVTALHVSIGHFDAPSVRTPSVSTQIATLRQLLSGLAEGSSGEWFRKAAKGEIPLVVSAVSADIIGTLIRLKREVEAAHGSSMRFTISGATEAYILAKELSEAGVGVILNPPRPFPATWEQRRILPGPPLSQRSAVAELLSYNVTVGLGNAVVCEALHTREDVAWAALESNGVLSKKDAFALASVNLEKLLGARTNDEDSDLVATSGGDLLEMSAKVRAVLSPRKQRIDLL